MTPAIMLYAAHVALTPVPVIVRSIVPQVVPQVVKSLPPVQVSNVV